MPAWKCPELLRVSLPSLRQASAKDTRIVIILNEVDDESVAVCRDNGVEYIERDDNQGPAAVDFLLDSLETEYVANVNSDMIFQRDWDTRLMYDLASHPEWLSVSANLVELIPDTSFVKETLDFFDPKTPELFQSRCESGEYLSRAVSRRVCGNHPIIVRTKDHKAVGGYSGGDNIWQLVRCCAGLDVEYIWRLWMLHNKKKTYVCSSAAFVLHGVSMNAKSLPRTSERHSEDVSAEKMGMTEAEFCAATNYWEEV